MTGLKSCVSYGSYQQLYGTVAYTVDGMLQIDNIFHFGRKWSFVTYVLDKWYLQVRFFDIHTLRLFTYIVMIHFLLLGSKLNKHHVSFIALTSEDAGCMQVYSDEEDISKAEEDLGTAYNAELDGS